MMFYMSDNEIVSEFGLKCYPVFLGARELVIVFSDSSAVLFTNNTSELG